MAQTNPRDLRDEIARAISSLMACHGLTNFVAAVRSSAVDEDGTGASFAGQYETYLNITGVQEIFLTVLRCWESAYAWRAMEYRRQHGLSTEHVQMGILVHQLVAADVAALAFSANPVTGSREEVLINASWGLGESIVSGAVTPDTFVVRKPDIVQFNLGTPSCPVNPC
jgi:phosphoenolpyruvate synthase/pyruvate phosphate dikinase